ncbi:MAG TPA: LptF/LptG family permease [Cyclobacteriaceae bacterium]|jgi:lipopolysaccharide export system permease protein|nr:LptF/LptG family permease [Cytophagales bacterium]HNT51101.1 LptF/LptG family permease [Cyclobacteriaceae bacterium]
MTILDRYIIKKILATFFYVVLILVAIITVIDVTEKIDKFVTNNLNTASILGYYGDFIPWIAGLIAPITVFITIVYVTSRMAAHTEIIAILSSGVSFRRLLVPYFIAAFIIACLSFYLNGWVIPKSNRERIEFELQYFKKNNMTSRSNIHMQIEPNVYLFLQNFSSQSNVGHQFTLERFDSNRLVEKLTAENIQWDTTKLKWKLRYWKHKQVDSIFRIQPAGATFKLASRGDEMDTTLSVTPEDFEATDRGYDGMTIDELTEHIDKIRFRGSTGVEVYETERQIRFAIPFTIFVLVFMGVLVSARKSRGGTGFQIALGFLLSFIFILFFTMTRTFAETGSLPPLLAAWLPNGVFVLISLGMYKYVPR